MSYYPPDPLLRHSGWQSLKVILHGKPRPRRWRSIVLWLERALWL